MKTVQSLALELSDAFKPKKRESGEKFICLKDDAPKWMTQVIHAVHGDKLPDDTTYNLIDQCATALAEAQDGGLEDAISDIEPDAYTSDLTAWLHARVDHVYYLTQAIDEFALQIDGFQALALAQKMQIDEVGMALLAELQKLVEDEVEA